MLFSLITLLLSSLVPCVLAVGRAIVTNQCDTPVYLWTVGNSVSKQTTLSKDSTYGELFRSDSTSGGIAFKITSTPNGLTTSNASQLIFAYNVDNSSIWYDLNSLFGDGFAGRTVRVQPSEEACDTISWHDGRKPAGSQRLAEATHQTIRERVVRTALEVITAWHRSGGRYNALPDFGRSRTPRYVAVREAVRRAKTGSLVVGRRDALVTTLQCKYAKGNPVGAIETSAV
ncbi:hypothetical protein OPT61_g4998 [Boeremia exigua]|uniref:Uncharacterized protein n=1 Tax=Boeremia exigua TaxID=749465 RepID=A0ACC2IBX3_9PLEO|nr:hypothetical protein OPT61_g4998 [Boeremia exigua]